MPYDFGRSKDHHKQELTKLLSNPHHRVFVPVGMFYPELDTKVFMVCLNGKTSSGIWLTQQEGQMLDKRISAAIDRFIKEIEYDILPDSDDEFAFQNDFVIREMPDDESWD